MSVDGDGKRRAASSERQANGAFGTFLASYGSDERALSATPRPTSVQSGRRASQQASQQPSDGSTSVRQPAAISDEVALMATAAVGLLVIRRRHLRFLPS